MRRSTARRPTSPGLASRRSFCGRIGAGLNGPREQDAGVVIVTRVLVNRWTVLVMMSVSVFVIVDRGNLVVSTCDEIPPLPGTVTCVDVAVSVGVVYEIVFV